MRSVIMSDFKDFCVWFLSIVATTITLSILIEYLINPSFNDIYAYRLVAVSVFFGTGIFLFFRDLCHIIYFWKYIKEIIHNDYRHPLAES